MPLRLSEDRKRRTCSNFGSRSVGYVIRKGGFVLDSDNITVGKMQSKIFGQIVRHPVHAPAFRKFNSSASMGPVLLRHTPVSRIYVPANVFLSTLHFYRSKSTTSSTFHYADLQIQPSSERAPKPDWNKLVFGKHFSDHMLQVHWTEKTGWDRPVIHKVQPLALHPAAKVFHYAIELFEGMKAFRSGDDKILMYRPDKNMERMNNTATRATLPNFDSDELVKCIARLIDIDRDWVPATPNSSLYIRPCLIGTEAKISVHDSSEAILFVLICPVGGYFTTGVMKPIRLLADPKYVRSWPGGAGASKMGSNYAPTLKIAREAEKLNCQQVLWLFGPDHQITEVGAMNLMTFWINEQGEKELVTAPLEDGLVLPGVTRDSLLTLCREWGEFKVSERRYTLGDVKRAADDGRLIEMFCTGTACVVSPVGEILYEGDCWKLPTFETQQNALSIRLMKALQDIQYGRTQYSNWTVDVDELLGNSTEKPQHRKISDDQSAVDRRATKRA